MYCFLFCLMSWCCPIVNKTFWCNGKCWNSLRYKGELGTFCSKIECHVEHLFSCTLCKVSVSTSSYCPDLLVSFSSCVPWSHQLTFLGGGPALGGWALIGGWTVVIIHVTLSSCQTFYHQHLEVIQRHIVCYWISYVVQESLSKWSLSLSESAK